MRKKEWWDDEVPPEGYYQVEPKRGREFILKICNGQDVLDVVQRFAVKNNITIARIHTAYMGAFKPQVYLKYVPHPERIDPESASKYLEDVEGKRWMQEIPVTTDNLGMILSLNGFIVPKAPGEPPEVKIHFLTGASWDSELTGGHMEPGTKVSGEFCCFVTELTGLDIIWADGQKFAYEHWFKEIGV